MKKTDFSDRSGAAVIYEVRLHVDTGVIDEFDLWLERHMDEMLGFPGFESATLVCPEAESDDSRTRIVRYRVASREQLQSYLDRHAAGMRAAGLQRFGERFRASRNIYASEVSQPGQSAHRCRNCDTLLSGQYCAVCGQRDKHRIISLWELLRDVVGDLFEVDSRVWRTLRPLLLRPGRLTLEYLRGKRVRYTPPFRLYLVSSLLFFLVAFFGSGDAGFSFEDIVFDQDRAAEDQAIEPAADPVDAEKSVDPPDSAPDGSEEAAADAAGPPADDNESATLAERCEDIDIGDGRVAELLHDRARRACERLTAEGGVQRFVAELLDNVPRTMFFFLPLLALAMQLLYPLSQRYYVEHLLFLLHFHSFFFVLFTLTTLLSRVPVVLPAQDAATALATFAAVLYTPVYLYLAMRRVYAQGRAATWLKFIALLGVYLFSLLFLAVLVLLFTALSL